MSDMKKLLEFAPVGNALIDRDHQQFIDLVNRIAGATSAEFASLFDELYAHTQEHFDRENELMTQYGFPAEVIHRNEHQRVLNEFKQFQRQTAKGSLSMARAFVIEQVPEWFNLHIATMDSALASFIDFKSQSVT